MRSRSDDPVAAALNTAVDVLVEDIRAVAAANPVVLIDGRSGAGKTSLARLLAERWPVAGRVQLVALDSIYPGWDGLEAGVQHAVDGFLRPHGRGRLGEWTRWDWASDSEAETHAIDPSLGLLVEGSGILTPDSARVADVRIWMESEAQSRRARALARDGETYAPHWDRWAAQELRHIERDAPRELATRIITVP